ncbi:MAG: Clp protease N-terminal domain-containing protein [Mycobacteriales bacterium]
MSGLSDAFTDVGRAALVGAEGEAIRLRHRQIEPEHLLLAVLKRAGAQLRHPLSGVDIARLEG